jgi:hypothetical protein
VKVDDGLGEILGRNPFRVCGEQVEDAVFKPGRQLIGLFFASKFSDLRDIAHFIFYLRVIALSQRMNQTDGCTGLTQRYFRNRR